MKPVIALVAALIVLLPSVSFAAGPAGAAEEDDAEPFYAKMEDHILTSAEAVADIVSGYAENLPLSPGTVSVFEAVVNGEYSSPQTAPVEDLVRYTGDTRIEELHISGGAGIEIEDGATVTVDRLFAESGGETISFSSAGLGCIVIKSLVIEGLPVPLPEMTVRAEDASVESVYRHSGEVRSFALDVSYSRSLEITIGGYTAVYSSEDRSDIRISAELDLTDYKRGISAPGLLSTTDKLLRYIGLLDLARIDLKIDIGGKYGVPDYPNPFQITDMSLSVDSHKDQDSPYYSAELHIGNVRLYPVNNSGMRIFMELPASAMKDGSKSAASGSKEFALSADSVIVNRVEPDDPLDVRVEKLAIGMASGPEPRVSLTMDKMAFQGTETNSLGSFRADTAVTGFKAEFKGVSDLPGNMKNLTEIIISSGSAEGTVALEKTEYRMYGPEGLPVQEVTVSGLNLKITVAIPRFRIHLSFDSLEYSDPSTKLFCSPLKFDLWNDVSPVFGPGGSGNIRDLLKILSFKSAAEADAEGDHDYRFTIGRGEAFMIGFATEGLRVNCGDDTVIFDKPSVRSLSPGADNEIRYLRMTDEEIVRKVPAGLRSRLGSEEVIELSDSYGIKKLGGEAAVTLRTDKNPKETGVYYLDVYDGSLEKKEFAASGGYVSFKTDSMGMYAVSGPLSEPDDTWIAFALLISAAIIGAATVLIGKRLLKRNRRGGGTWIGKKPEPERISHTAFLHRRSG